MAEFELDIKEVVAPDTMFDGVQVPITKNQKKSLYIDEAAKALSQGEDMEVAVRDIATKDVEQINAEGAERHVATTKAVQAGAVEEIALSAPEALPEAVTAAQASIVEAGAAILASKYDWVDSVSGGNTTRDERMSVALDMGLVASFSKEIDEQSTLGFTADLVGAMFLPASHFNVAATKAGLEGDKASIMDAAKAPAYVKMVKGFRMSLSLEERAALDERVLTPMINSITDNKVERADLARMFTNLTDEGVEAFFVGLDAVDSTLIATQITSSIFKVVKSANTLRRLSKLNRTLAARQVAEAVAKKVEGEEFSGVLDDTVAMETGIHQSEAAVVGNPLVPEGVFHGAPEGSQGKFRDYLTNVEDHLTRARDNLNLTIGLTKTEELEVAASVEKRLKRDFDLENFTYTKTDTGLNFTFDKHDGGELVEANLSIDFELKDLGGLQQSKGLPLPPVARHILSPLFQAGADASTFIKSAAGVMFATERSRNQYGKALAIALSPIKGTFKSNKSFVKSADKIDGIMRNLENTDTIPTYHKLVNEGVNGVKLTEKEFQAYTGVRKIMDDLWWDNNDALRREWKIKGVKSITGDTRNWFAKEMEDASSAIQGYQGGTVGILQDGSITSTKGSLTSDEITQLYSEGKRLVRSWSNNKTEWFETPNGLAEYAIVGRLEVGELPPQVLGKIPNYVPRVNEDASWFLKKKETVDINGVPTVVEKAIAFGSTKGQVVKYLDDVLAKVSDENPEAAPFNRDDYVTRFDQEQVADSSSADSISLGGGLVRGHRSSTPLVYAGTGAGKQTNVVDSIQNYLSVTADKVNMSEWRAEVRHRLIEEAATYPEVAEAVREAGGWAGYKEILGKSNIPSSRKQKMLTMYDQVEAMSRIPTRGEKAYQDFVVEIGKRFDEGAVGESGAVQQGIAKFMYKYSDENPTNIAKSWTFNTVLGMFNPAQVITQASGITAAYSIHPVHAANATWRWILAGALDFTTNEKAAEGFLGIFAKNAGVDTATMKKDYEFWRKSGMYDSVIAGNADAATLKLGLPYDAGLLRRTLSGVVDAGRTPFNIGEVANMRVSFFTALERAKKIHPNFAYTDKELVEVIGRAEDLRLNMSSANKANIQKGFLGLPTQFLNIIKATAELPFSKNLTVAERGRFGAGQIILYGTAGIPLVGYLADGAMEAVGIKGTRVEGDGGYTSEELNSYKNGIVGKMLAGYGVESAISGKFTLASDIYNTIVDNFFGDEAKVQKAMFGASYRTGDRVYDIVMNTLAFGRVSIENLLDDDADPMKQKLVAIELAKSLVDLPSSTRQIQAALDLHQGWVKRSDGTTLLHVNSNIGEAYATALAIPLQEIGDRYKVSKEIRDISLEERDEATRIISLLNTMETGLMGVNFDYSPSAAHKAATMLIDRIKNERGGDSAKRVMAMVRNRITNPTSWQEKNTQSIIQFASEEEATAVMNLDVTTQRILERGKR